jgi:hypothetical protein
MKPDMFGQTALFWASHNGHLEVVKYVVKQGLTKDDIMKQDNGGRIALSVAQNILIEQILLREKTLNEYLMEKNYNKVIERCKIMYTISKITEGTCCICINNESNCMTLCKHGYCLDCYINYHYIYGTKNAKKCSLCRESITNDLIIDSSIIM